MFCSAIPQLSYSRLPPRESRHLHRLQVSSPCSNKSWTLLSVFYCMRVCVCACMCVCMCVPTIALQSCPMTECASTLTQDASDMAAMTVRVSSCDVCVGGTTRHCIHQCMSHTTWYHIQGFNTYGTCLHEV